MSFRIVLEAFGEKQIERDIFRIRRRTADAEPLWAVLHERLMAIEEEQFETEGARSSGGWDALADSTIAQKARAGLDPRILHATLTLRKSLTSLAEGHLFLTGPTWMVFGSTIEYGPYHQRGNDNLPRRRPIELTEMDRQRFVKDVQLWIMRGIVAPL